MGRHKKSLEDRVLALLKLWVERLWLNQWHITHSFVKEIESGAPGCIVHAMVNCDWCYQQADIVFSSSSCEDLPQDELSRVVLHELCHVVVNEMRERRPKNEERTVTTLTNVMYAAYAVHGPNRRARA